MNSKTKSEVRGRLILVNSWPMIDSRGGTERVCVQMANEFASRHWDVAIVFFDDKTGELGYAVEDKVKVLNAKKYTPMGGRFLINLLSLSFSARERKRRRKRWRSWLQARNFNLAVHEIWGNGKCDVIVSFQPESTYCLIEFARVSAPVITMIHTNPSDFIYREEFDLYRESLNRSALIQVLMPEFKSRLRRVLPTVPIIEIPNCCAFPKKAATLEGEKIICVARLVPEKNPELLIEAFAKISAKFPEWKLEWWGRADRDFNYLQKIRQKIKSEGIEDRFLICGETDDVSDKLRSAAIFAFPSKQEGFGLAVLEAMAMGLPCIGLSECSGVNKLVDDGVSGFLVQADPDHFAARLEMLINDFGLRRKLGAVGREKAKKYSPVHVWDSWERVFSKFIECKVF